MMLSLLLLTVFVFLCYYDAQITQIRMVEAFVLTRRSTLPSLEQRNLAVALPIQLLGQKNDDDNSYNDSDQEQQNHPYRSISDYMGGHHAGKFDFDTTIYGVTSLNYEKSIVFDDVASRLQASSMNVAPINDDVNDEVGFESSQSNLPPKWAMRPIKIPSSQHSLSAKAIVLASGQHHQSVIITNDERSWEPFYASIESLPPPSESSIPSSASVRILDDNNGSHMSTLRVMPTCGKLAPRGGSPPYSDSCEFQITLSSTQSVPVPGNDGGSGEDSSITMIHPSTSTSLLYLVVRTECDSWIWPIILQ